MEIVEIGHLPLYNQDLDDDPPPAWRSVKARVKSANAIFFVTPEHNRSVPAALKNVLDIVSRPFGQSAWKGKPAAVISVRRARSAVSAPTTTCGSRWLPLTFR